MYEIWKAKGIKSGNNVCVLERTADKCIIKAWHEGTSTELSEEELKEELGGCYCVQM